MFELSFGNSEQLITLSFSTNDDSLPELTEGFLCYLEIIENQLHPHDVGRIDFFNRLVLVRILDNDGKNVWALASSRCMYICSPFQLSMYMCIYLSIYLLKSGDNLVNYRTMRSHYMNLLYVCNFPLSSLPL